MSTTELANSLQPAHRHLVSNVSCHMKRSSEPTRMNDREAFLTVIREDPSDFNILAYADWLEEQGDGACDELRKAVAHGPTVHVDDSVRQMDEARQRWFAANCAERVLPLWQRNYGTEDWQSQAISRARQFAVGICSLHELERASVAASDAVDDACGGLWHADEDLWPSGDRARPAARALACATSSLIADVNNAQRFARVAGDTVEGRWIFCHAVRILHLGLIPLTEEERNHYV